MTIKAVTTAQLEQIRKMATEKGIGKEMFQVHGLNNGAVAMALDAIKTASLPRPEFVAPEGGRIVEVTVPVDLGREWQAAVNAAGPNTPPEYNVRKVADKYAPGTGIVSPRQVLVNFGPKGGSWDRALAWAAQYPHLKRTTPRHVFAIGEHKPQLHREVGMNPMYVVATTECTFEQDRQACYVWWDDAGRGASLRWVGDFDYTYVWFSFECE